MLGPRCKKLRGEEEEFPGPSSVPRSRSGFFRARLLLCKPGKDTCQECLCNPILGSSLRQLGSSGNESREPRLMSLISNVSNE